MGVHLVRRADLLDPAVIHHHDAVGNLQRLLLVVRDEHAGDLQIVVESPQPAPQFLAHLRVQCAEGLVEQQHAGFDRQRTRQCDALPLTARELIWISIRQPVELHQLQKPTHARTDLGLGRALATRLDAQPEGDVVEHRHVPEKRVVLEHETDLAALHREPGRIRAVDDDATGIGHFEAGDDPQQRGLAAARRSEESDEFAMPDVERNVVEGGKAPEALGEVPDFDAHAAAVALNGVSASRVLSTAFAVLTAASWARSARHSISDLSASVTSASSARIEATANAATT